MGPRLLPFAASQESSLTSARPLYKTRVRPGKFHRPARAGSLGGPRGSRLARITNIDDALGGFIQTMPLDRLWGFPRHPAWPAGGFRVLPGTWRGRGSPIRLGGQRRLLHVVAEPDRIADAGEHLPRAP